MSPDRLFNPTTDDPEVFFGLLLGGMSRAQEEFRAKLNTVDKDGNVIATGDNEPPQENK